MSGCVDLSDDDILVIGDFPPGTSEPPKPKPPRKKFEAEKASTKKNALVIPKETPLQLMTSGNSDKSFGPIPKPNGKDDMPAVAKRESPSPQPPSSQNATMVSSASIPTPMKVTAESKQATSSDFADGTSLLPEEPSTSAPDGESLVDGSKADEDFDLVDDDDEDEEEESARSAGYDFYKDLPKDKIAALPASKRMELECMVNLAREIDKRIANLEASILEGAVEHEQFRIEWQRSVAQSTKIVDEIITMLGLDEDYPEESGVPPFQYLQSGCTKLDKYLTYLVRKELEKEKKKYRQGEIQGLIHIDANLLAKAIKKIADDKGQKYLRHKLTGRRIVSEEVQVSLHKQIMRYRKKNFQHGIGTKFALVPLNKLKVPDDEELRRQLEITDAELAQEETQQYAEIRRKLQELPEDDGIEAEGIDCNVEEHEGDADDYVDEADEETMPSMSIIKNDAKVPAAQSDVTAVADPVQSEEHAPHSGDEKRKDRDAADDEEECGKRYEEGENHL